MSFTIPGGYTLDTIDTSEEYQDGMKMVSPDENIIITVPPILCGAGSTGTELDTGGHFHDKPVHGWIHARPLFLPHRSLTGSCAAYQSVGNHSGVYFRKAMGDPDVVRFFTGLEFFQTIREQSYYYVDKTRLIKELLQYGRQVNLFTRPRRFGKTLNMDMLWCFFEIGCDPVLFDGLAIAEEKELCEKHMGKYPVIMFSLKDIKAMDYVTARGLLVSVINEEARRHKYLSDSTMLSEDGKEIFRQLNRKKM